MTHDGSLLLGNLYTETKVQEVTLTFPHIETDAEYFFLIVFINEGLTERSYVKEMRIIYLI